MATSTNYYQNDINHQRHRPTISVIYENEIDFLNSKTPLDLNSPTSTSTEKIISDPNDIIYILNGDGIVNPIYTNSPPSVHKVSAINEIHLKRNLNGTNNGSRSQSMQNMNDSLPSIRITRENYWSCSLPRFRCKNWTKREKILFVVLILLSVIIVVLAGCYTFANKSQKPPSTPQDWLPWKL